MTIRYVIHTPVELRYAVRDLAECAHRIRAGFDSIGGDSEPVEDAFRLLAFVLEAMGRKIDPEIGDEIQTLTAPIDGSGCA